MLACMVALSIRMDGQTPLKTGNWKLNTHHLFNSVAAMAAAAAIAIMVGSMYGTIHQVFGLKERLTCLTLGHVWRYTKDYKGSDRRLECV